MPEARFLSSNRTTAGPENQKKTIKTILFDKFLKYQLTICVEPQIPFSHLILIVVLTCITGSVYFPALYCISIVYILSTFYLSEKFPDSFGFWYLSFLKRHSSTEAFEKYCGNLWGVVKAIIGNTEAFNTIIKNGLGKGMVCVVGILVAEHAIHQAKLGQLLEYTVEEYMNGGIHPSGQPFLFKPNGPSVLEKYIGRTGR